MLDKRAIEQAVAEQREELNLRDGERMATRREESLVDTESEMAQVVIGMRRSGKSTLCHNVMRPYAGQYAYVNFDDERLGTLRSEDLNDLLEVLYKVYGNFRHLFLDEIQNIDGWHLFVNRLLRQRMRIIITGSNAKLLSGELATHLTGRCERIELFTFSFAEYCDYRGVETKSVTTRAEAARRQAFDDYLREGGFPELLRNGRRPRYVADLTESILKRDIEQRHGVRHTEAFETLANHLLNTAPITVVETELAEVVGLKSTHTVNNYIGFLKEAYVLTGVKRYSTKSRQRARGEKLYATDVALMDSRPDAFAGANLGWRLETIVCIELLRRNRPVGRDVYYYRNADGYEADFVVCRGNRVEEVYQVSYDISNERTRRRELRGLLTASRETRCDNLTLITDHERETTEAEGKRIEIVPAHEWLLR